MAEPAETSSSSYLHGTDRSRLINWWASLDDNRGLRARLRRVDRPDDALLTDAFFNFLQYVPESWAEPKRLCSSALVACILAQIKTNQTGKSFAAQLGSGEGDRPVMSELRFRQLLKSRTPEEFYRRLLRAVRLLEGSVNILSITDGILRWYEEFLDGANRKPHKRLSVQWAHDYYISSNK
jgi:CRISPR system Cascade subunit CasB